MTLYAGIDIGSVSTKLVIVDHLGAVKCRVKHRSGIDFSRAAKTVFDKGLLEISAEKGDIKIILATGYGRDSWEADKKLTEITCHGKAGFAFLNRACTILDIGGQDTKIIPVNDNGQVGDFKMNRKCAAGTGAFLEEMARKLDMTLEQISKEAQLTQRVARLSSFCTVFAMTEVFKRIQEGAGPQSLARGVYHSMVTRTVEMSSLSGDVVASGGVANYHPVFIDLLAKRTGADICVMPKAQFAGAWGAALLALEEDNQGV